MAMDVIAPGGCLQYKVGATPEWNSKILEMRSPFCQGDFLSNIQDYSEIRSRIKYCLPKRKAALVAADERYASWEIWIRWLMYIETLENWTPLILKMISISHSTTAKMRGSFIKMLTLCFPSNDDIAWLNQTLGFGLLSSCSNIFASLWNVHFCRLFGAMAYHFLGCFSVFLLELI